MGVWYSNSKTELDMAGLEYYIWATDGTNETTAQKI